MITLKKKVATRMPEIKYKQCNYFNECIIKFMWQKKKKKRHLNI